MCKLGDIIVINKYIGEGGNIVNRHSFVVIDDEKGVISGLDYDMVASAISSFKSEEQRERKLKYMENMELPINSMKEKKLKGDSYVKADQAHYFNKSKLDYYVLGTLKEKYIKNLLSLIVQLRHKGKTKQIVENL